MLKHIPDTLTVSIHGPIPPNRYWPYYTGPELGELAKDPNATAVLNVGAIEQHGPHLPTATDTLMGMELLGAALAKLSPEALVLALPPTNMGKSEEHADFVGSLSYRGDTLRMVLMDTAMSVARTGFKKLVLLGSHGGNVGLLDDYFRDLHMASGLRIFKVQVGALAPIPGLVSPEESAISLHSGDGETSVIRYLAPEIVNMDQAGGYVYDSQPEIGFSFKGQDVIEAWVTNDLSPNGAIGNPLTSSPEKGQKMFEAKRDRLALLLEAVYANGKRESRLVSAHVPQAVG